MDIAAFRQEIHTIAQAAYSILPIETQSLYGQYFTSPSVAQFMASLSSVSASDILLLDAGAGSGILTAMFVAEMCQRNIKPVTIRSICYEIDETLYPFLQRSLELCLQLCREHNIGFNYDLRCANILEEYAANPLEFANRTSVNVAILNPPYRKLSSKSEAGSALRRRGIHSTNLYTAFVEVVARALKCGGEMIAITPRSFCNGPHHKAFRTIFLDQVYFMRIHLFESRERVFAHHSVLQETLIFRVVKASERPTTVEFSSSIDAASKIEVMEVPYEQILVSDDPSIFVRLPIKLAGTSDLGPSIQALTHSIDDLDIEVSTGPLVDFRNREELCEQVDDAEIPLIYAHNILRGMVVWPIAHKKKPLGVSISERTLRQSLPLDYYVVVNRMSSKDERRRIAAGLVDAGMFSFERICFENHVNYFHRKKRGLDKDLARGLTIFLNSGVVDIALRYFNGHTQINVADLRSIRYPSQDQLRELGYAVPIGEDQQSINKAIGKIVQRKR